MITKSQQKFISRSEADTIGYARRLAETITSPVIIALTGELGAGKTVFVRGLCDGLGFPSSVRVTSPSYKLINAYRGGRFDVWHVDAWRLTGSDAFLDLDILDLSVNGVLAIEWAERIDITQIAPGSRMMQFRINSLDEATREIVAID